MDPFPEQWELLSLFEVEPVVSDRDVPWFYNSLTFETTRGENHVRCEIEPAYDLLRIIWWHQKHEVVSLDLNRVRSLRVITGAGTDFLIASFRNADLLDLEFHLKPTIKLRWGTSPD